MRLSTDIQVARIYWLRGNHPRGTYAVTDPPAAGWRYAFLLDGNTALDPHTYQAYELPSGCLELRGADMEPYWNKDSMLEAIREGWRWSVDEASKALMTRVFEALGEEAPEIVSTASAAPRKGKAMAGDGVLKPVKRSSKRGAFLLELVNAGGSMSLKALERRFNMTRNNALSYLYMLRKDHGVGYALGGGRVTLSIPDGELWI